MRRQHHYTAPYTFCQALRPKSERVSSGRRGGSVRGVMQPAVGRRRRQSGAQGRERVGQGEKTAERVKGLALDQKLDAPDGGALAECARNGVHRARLAAVAAGKVEAHLVGEVRRDEAVCDADGEQPGSGGQGTVGPGGEGAERALRRGGRGGTYRGGPGRCRGGRGGGQQGKSSD